MKRTIKDPVNEINVTFYYDIPYTKLPKKVRESAGALKLKDEETFGFVAKAGDFEYVMWVYDSKRLSVVFHELYHLVRFVAECHDLDSEENMANIFGFYGSKIAKILGWYNS